jgi:NAD(P)-dependent dehydrogenase (short-subunit alcohol dehydrogenase family)
VKGLFFTVQKALPLMKDGGSIILNASIASSKGMQAMSGKMSLTAEQQQQFGAQIVEQMPMGRIGNPDEIASAVLFLASSESSPSPASNQPSMVARLKSETAKEWCCDIHSYRKPMNRAAPAS